MVGSSAEDDVARIVDKLVVLLKAEEPPEDVR
jgi:hypothetical protein